MITLHWVYALMGAVFAGYALLGAADRSNPRRFTTAAFWALLALSMWAGDRIGDIGNGVLVLGLVAIAATESVTSARDTTKMMAPAGFGPTSYRGTSELAQHGRVQQ